MALSLLLIAAAMAYSFLFHREDLLWYCGLSISLGLLFIVTALSREEMEAEIAGEAKGRIEHWKAAHKELEEVIDHERQLWTAHKSALENSVSSQTTSHQETIERLQTELMEVRRHQEHAAEQLAKKDAEKIKYQEQLNSAKALVTQQPPENSQALTKERDYALVKYNETERALRRSEGKLKQLREQFEQKAEELDETRRQLFRKEEELQGLQHKHAEEMSSSNDTERKMQRHFSEMEKECDRLSSEYRKEVDALHELVAALMTQRL